MGPYVRITTFQMEPQEVCFPFLTKNCNSNINSGSCRLIDSLHSLMTLTWRNKITIKDYHLEPSSLSNPLN